MNSTFFDEVLKLAASKANFTLTQTRKGRRPMSVETMLRKDSEGTLLKHKLADAVGVQMIDGQKKVLNEQESEEMMEGIQQELADISESIPKPDAVFKGLQGLFNPDEEEEEEEKEAGAAETYLPWYGAAIGGTGGGLLGEKLAPAKYRTLGTLGGALVGTGLGLHPAVVAGRAIDRARAKPSDLEKEAKAQRAVELLSNLARKKGIDPKFIGAIKQVETVAGSGQRSRAAEIAQNVRGYLKAAAVLAKFSKSLDDVGEKLYSDPPKAQPKKFNQPVLSEIGKTADSSKVQWLELPYTEGERGMQNAPVLSKKKPGDMPTVDSDAMNGPSRYDAGWAPPQTAIPSKTASALKAAAVKAVSPDLLDNDPSDAPDRMTPNPNRIQHQTDKNWFIGSAPDAAPITEVESDSVYKRAHVLTPEEAYYVRLGALEDVSSMKLASPVEYEELYKEAIFSRLRQMLPGRKLVQLGDEVIDLTPASSLSYRGLGRHLDELSRGFRPQKGVTLQDLAAVGADKGVAGRIFGEALHGAGHHMTEASNLGIAANPFGKAVGGGIEGAVRGAGREVQRSLGDAALVGGGGIRGSLGRGLEANARRIGMAGEIGTGAAAATALGTALSPMAAGVGAAAKSMGVYYPLKGAVGHLGANVLKDTASTALEHGLAHTPRAINALRRATAAVA